MNTLHSHTNRNPDLKFLQLRQGFTDLRQSVNLDFLDRYDAAVKGLEHEIWTLMSTDMHTRREGESKKSYNEIIYEILDDMDNPHIGEIRVILYDSGLAFPLWWGDWLVDRGEETQSKMLGIVPQHAVMDYIADTASTHESQLIALHEGPGNGQIMHEIFHNGNTKRADIALDGEHKKSWNTVGIADKIYFPISGILENFWKGGDKRVGAEVARFFATQIQYAVQEEKYKHPDKMHPLQKNLRDIRGFLEERRDIMNGKITHNQYLADAEFDGDKKQFVSLSSEAQELIGSYTIDPQSFIKTYFGDDFQGDAIIKKAPIYMRNIFLGDFSQIDEKFPGKKIFHFISSVRGSSHIDNEPYKNLIRASLQKLAPGGLMIDDGVRRSYTAEIRIDEIMQIIRGANMSDIRSYVIRSPEGNIISVLFDKGVKNADGIYTFREPSELSEKVVLKGYTLDSLDRYDSIEAFNYTVPSLARTRDEVMRRLELPKDDMKYPTISQMNPVVEYIEQNHTKQDVSEIVHDAQVIVNTLISNIRAQISGVDQSFTKE